MEAMLFDMPKPQKVVFTPRDYQVHAINAGVSFFKSEKKSGGLIVLPTGSGKSIVIANIAKGINGRTVVFQPSKEILEQNFAKYRSYGFPATIYSASAGQKKISDVTFATIGSVATKHHLFREFENIIIDESHLVNSKGGMYHDFIHACEGAKVLGLTATPYRLSSSMEGAMLKFLTRTKPKIFSEVLYVVQNDVLFNQGHLAKLEYYPVKVIDRRKLTMNSTGTDFTDKSLKAHYKEINLPGITIDFANRLLKKRKNLLVFCALIEEAELVVRCVPGAELLTGETPTAKREKILSDFKKGIIRCVVNVGVLTTGFDYPALETILIARSTMSLALYYQIVGRAIRPHPEKASSWIVDLGDNVAFFGKVETLKIIQDQKGLYWVMNNGRRLTNTMFQKY
jgi:DNA repair protein RadD